MQMLVQMLIFLWQQTGGCVVDSNRRENFNIHVRKNWKIAYWYWNCFYFISCLQQWWGVAILAYLIKAMLLGELCSSMYWTGIICLHNFWNISIGWPHFYRLKKNIGNRYNYSISPKKFHSSKLHYFMLLSRNLYINYRDYNV